MPLVRALKTLVCVIYTMPSWSPFSRPQVGTGAILFCVWHVIMCTRAPVSYDKHNSFPHLFISVLGRKQPEISQQRLFIAFSQHLAGLDQSISLQSPVACHFGWFQLEPDMHYQLIAKSERFRFREPLEGSTSTAKIIHASLSYSPKSFFFESRWRSQTISGLGKILASGLEQ